MRSTWLERLVEDPLVERLPLDVERLEPPGQPRRLVRIVGEQQPEPVGGVADPAGGVEPGAEDEAEMTGAELLARRARSPRPAPGRPGQRALGEEPEPVLDQDPVLAHQRHDVGHGGERDQVEQIVRKVGREAERRHQRLHQLEGDAGAAERRRARGVARLLGIDDRERRRQLGPREVVVGDDHADACRRARPGPCRPR